MAAENDAPQIIDGQPLLEFGRRMKEEGNSFVKQKKYNDAVKCYENGIATLDKADGHPMLRDEVEEMIALKVILYGNMAQCHLSMELYRRCVETATSCLNLNDSNVKALYRRSLAHEALKEWDEAIKDTVALQKLGGGSMTPEAVEQRLVALQDKKTKALEEKKKYEDSDDDEHGDELIKMKQRFDEIVDKYGLKDDDSASEVADWLTSGEWNITIKRVSQRWGMTELEAYDFLTWIAKGCEFQRQNAANSALLDGAHGNPDLPATF